MDLKELRISMKMIFLDNTFFCSSLFDIINCQQQKQNQKLSMLNKKLSDLFQIRKQTPKKQEKQVSSFDENYFHCRLINRGINTELIRIQTQVKQNGQPLDQIRCKWYIKNSQDFKQIQDVTSEYYQPCLDDIGSIVCVQIEPFIQGKKYKGITIMKESQPIRIDDKLQQQLQKFLQEGKIRFDARIQAIFSQNPKYQSFQLPLQIKIQITNKKISFLTNGQQFESVLINEQYPNIEFIRKSFNSLILNYNQKESMKISLNNNERRDLLTLIVRTCAAQIEKINPQFHQQEKKQEQIKIEKDNIKEQSKVQNDNYDDKISQSEDKIQEIINEEDKQVKSLTIIEVAQQIQFNEESIPHQVKPKSTNDLQLLVKQKNYNYEPESSTKTKTQEPKQSNTTLILRLDELNKELKQNKRKYQELSLNYNIQKQNKLQIQQELEKIRQKMHKLEIQHGQSLKICRRVEQLSDDNRFYKNEISIMKKQLKKSKEIIKQLQNKMTNNEKSQANQYTNKLQEIKALNEHILQQKNMILRKQQDIQAQFDHFKHQYEALNNQNKKLQQRMTSLIHQTKNNTKDSFEFLRQTQRNTKNESKIPNEAEQKVKELQMKLKNLEMLLKYKASQGQNSSSFQLLTITQKQLQLVQVKKINKNLLEQVKYFRNKS